MHLYHYYNEAVGPFANLSELENKEANRILQKIKKESPLVKPKSGVTKQLPNTEAA